MHGSDKSSDGDPRREPDRLAFEIGRRAFELPPEARRAFLEQECDGDEGLIARILAVLDQDGSFDPDSTAPAALQFRGWRPSPGARVGKLRLVRQIGQGGMGEVWEAHQSSLDRSVAVKFLRPDTVRWSSDLERLHAEAWSSTRPVHPSLLVVHDVDTHEGMPYIVTELVESGRTLHDVVAGWSAEAGDPIGRARQAARWMARVSRAIHASHESGVTHRDIKARNVMLRERDDPVVLDFGVAGLAGGEGLAQGEGGTPHCTPPEVFAGDDDDPVRGDVYQLGLLLYELITLQRPFVEGGQSLRRERILAGGVPPVRHIEPRAPVELEAICRKAMARDPIRRYASAAALADDLERALERRVVPDAVREAGVPLWLSLRYLARRRRSALSAIVAVVALGVAGFTLLRDPLVPEWRQELRAVRVGRDADAPRSITSGLRPDDRVLVEVDATAPALVYALALQGDASGPRQVEVVWPQMVLSGGAEPERPTDRPEAPGIAVPAGRNVLQALSVPAEGGPSHVGLVLWVTDVPSPGLAHWFASIARGDEGGVTVEQATALLGFVLERTDRGLASQVDDAERRRLAAMFADRKDPCALDDWEVPGARKWARMWEVLR